MTIPSNSPWTNEVQFTKIPRARYASSVTNGVWPHFWDTDHRYPTCCLACVPLRSLHSSARPTRDTMRAQHWTCSSMDSAYPDSHAFSDEGCVVAICKDFIAYRPAGSTCWLPLTRTMTPRYMYFVSSGIVACIGCILALSLSHVQICCFPSGWLLVSLKIDNTVIRGGL